MKKGDIVTIYKDPENRIEIEGRAELIKFIGRFEGNEGEYTEDWIVRFPDRLDLGEVERSIVYYNEAKRTYKTLKGSGASDDQIAEYMCDVQFLGQLGIDLGTAQEIYCTLKC